MNYNRIGKFLSLVLEKTQDLLMEVEKDKGIKCSYMPIFPCVKYIVYICYFYSIFQ